MKIGDLMQMTEGRKRVFEVVGVTKDRAHIPDGWPIDDTGTAINPRFCEPCAE
jgi:hypothetical protein